MMTHVQQHESISRKTSGEGGRENVRVSKFVDLLCNYTTTLLAAQYVGDAREDQGFFAIKNITLNYAMPSSLETNQRSTGVWKLNTSIQL